MRGLLGLDPHCFKTHGRLEPEMDRSRDYRDIIGGVALLLIGCVIAIHAYINLELGTLEVMGPGMFPMGIGIMIAFCGLVICVPAFSRPGTLPKLQIQPSFIILGAIVGFSLIVQYFGFVPAIFFLVHASSLASRQSRLLGAVALSIGLCIAVYLIFRVGLGMYLPIVAWPN